MRWTTTLGGSQTYTVWGDISDDIEFGVDHWQGVQRAIGQLTEAERQTYNRCYDPWGADRPIREADLEAYQLILTGWVVEGIISADKARQRMDHAREARREQLRAAWEKLVHRAGHETILMGRKAGHDQRVTGRGDAHDWRSSNRNRRIVRR